MDLLGIIAFIAVVFSAVGIVFIILILLSLWDMSRVRQKSYEEFIAERENRKT